MRLSSIRMASADTATVSDMKRDQLNSEKIEALLGILEDNDILDESEIREIHQIKTHNEGKEIAAKRKGSGDNR